jgi:ADP-ribosylglycohydrolase
VNRVDRLRGCLVGTAVGDALGLPFEGLPPPRRIRWRRWLMVSDDTEHAFLIAAALASAGRDAGAFRRAFAWELRWWFLACPPALGWATLRACVRLWLGLRSGVFSAGNGPAMRSALLGVCYESAELREFVRISTEMTHTDPQAYWAALAVALCARTLPERFASEVLREIEEPVLRGLLTRAAESVARGASTIAFARAIGAGGGVSGYAYQTVPVAIHAWLSHPCDVEAAARAAIACGGDTDTVAAIACALAGSHGGVSDEISALIRDWPVSVAALRQVAEEVGGALDGQPSRRLSPHWWIPLRFFRNIAFALVHVPLWYVRRVRRT